MTTRELIEKIQIEVIETDLTPGRAGELLSQLSSLLGNVNEALTVVQMAYNRKFAEILDTTTSVAKAKALSQITSEYEEFLKVNSYRELVQEMMRSLKYLIKIKLEEYRESKYDNS